MHSANKHLAGMHPRYVGAVHNDRIRIAATFEKSHDTPSVTLQQLALRRDDAGPAVHTLATRIHKPHCDHADRTTSAASAHGSVCQQ
jgi:hypothetical protein